MAVVFRAQWSVVVGVDVYLAQEDFERGMMTHEMKQVGETGERERESHMEREIFEDGSNFLP